MNESFGGNALFQRAKFIAYQTVCIAVSLTCLFPLYWAFVSSLKTQETVFKDYSLFPAHPQWNNYLIAWQQGNFGHYLFNSIFYTVCVVAGVVLFSALAAYAFSRLQFPMKDLTFLLLILQMMIPVPGAFVALYVLLVKMDLINTRLGYILPQINGGLALGIFLLKTFIDKIPTELDDAAKIDGCNKLQVFWYVVLPLSKPALAVVTIFNTLAVWNEYLLASLVFSDKSLMPLQRGLMVFQGAYITQYPLLMAGIVITILPVIAIYLLMQRHIISGITSGALKS